MSEKTVWDVLELDPDRLVDEEGYENDLSANLRELQRVLSRLSRLGKQARMNPEAKAKWLEALRSGEYPQTRGTLHLLEGNSYDKPGYCCLGVLGTVAIPDMKIEEERGKMYFNNSSDLLRISDLVKVELDYDVAACLASVNDARLAFVEIADIVDEFL